MRTRAITEPSAGLMEASSPPDGLAIHAPSQAPELTGSISKRSSISVAVAVAVIIDLRKRYSQARRRPACRSRICVRQLRPYAAFFPPLQFEKRGRAIR